MSNETRRFSDFVSFERITVLYIVVVNSIPPLLTVPIATTISTLLIFIIFIDRVRTW